MLTQTKPTLALSSYKLDTRGYDERIRQLTLQNRQLQSLLEGCRVREKQLFEQLKNAKQEVASLRVRLTSQYTVNDRKSINSAKYKGGNMNSLVSQLEIERSKVREYKEMYENSERNNKEQASYYKRQLYEGDIQKDKLVRKYQEKLALSAVHVRRAAVLTPSVSSSTSLKVERSTGRQQSQMPVSLKKMPPTPKKAQQPVYHSQPVVRASESDESALLEMVTPVKQNLDKMQITVKQLLRIPQVVRFTKTDSPQKNKFLKLFRDFPFECEDEDAMLASYDFVTEELDRRGQEYSGERAMRLVMEYLNQV